MELTLKVKADKTGSLVGDGVDNHTFVNFLQGTGNITFARLNPRANHAERVVVEFTELDVTEFHFVRVVDDVKVLAHLVGTDGCIVDEYGFLGACVRHVYGSVHTMFEFAMRVIDNDAYFERTGSKVDVGCNVVDVSDIFMWHHFAERESNSIL